MEFIYLFLFRAISGAQNGFGYAQRKIGRYVCAGIMFLMISPFLYYNLVYDDYHQVLRVLSILSAIASAIGVLGVEDGFNDEISILPKDIHLWEYVATGGALVAVVFMGGNLLYVVASVYPALILHKGFVNIGTGSKFFRHGTDDPTGKTWGIPLLNISIPRSSLKIRIAFAVISIALAGLIWYLGWDINVNTLISKIW